MEDCASEREPLLHAVRVRVHRPPRGLRQAHGVQELGGTLARGAAAEAVHAREEHEVLEAGQAQVERAVAGRHEADELPQLARAAGRAVEHVRRAAGGLDQSAEDAHERRLPGAVGTQQRVDLTGLDLEADPAQRLDRAEPPAQIIDLHGRDGGEGRARVRARVEANGGDRHVTK